MRINVYLSFDGRCAEAFEFYAQVLGGSVEFTQTYGDLPMAGEMPPEQHGLVMHAQLGHRRRPRSTAPTRRRNGGPGRTGSRCR